MKAGYTPIKPFTQRLAEQLVGYEVRSKSENEKGYVLDCQCFTDNRKGYALRVEWRTTRILTIYRCHHEFMKLVEIVPIEGWNGLNAYYKEFVLDALYSIK